MATSREQILASLRSDPLDPVALPDLDGPWTTYDDPAGQFAEMLQAVGGRCETVSDLGALNEVLDGLEVYAQAQQVCSIVPDVGRCDVDLAAISDPKQLRSLDVTIAPGLFAVAENGAVWVTERQVHPRVMLFIAQHLILVVPADQIVHNMHQAYEQIDFAESGLGCFISGPSKTADIEQSLVMGAQGPRSLTVFLVEPG